MYEKPLYPSPDGGYRRTAKNPFRKKGPLQVPLRKKKKPIARPMQITEKSAKLIAEVLRSMLKSR